MIFLNSQVLIDWQIFIMIGSCNVLRLPILIEIYLPIKNYELRNNKRKVLIFSNNLYVNCLSETFKDPTPDSICKLTV